MKGNFKAILVSRSYCYLEESSVYLKSSQSILERSQVHQKTSRKSQKRPLRSDTECFTAFVCVAMSGDRFQSRLRSLINLWFDTLLPIKLWCVNYIVSSVCRKACQNRLSGQETPWGYWFVNQWVTYQSVCALWPLHSDLRLVFKSLRDKMGLENCRLCVSTSC